MNLPAEPPHELSARYGIGAIEVPTITGKDVEITPFEIGRMIVDGLGRLNAMYFGVGLARVSILTLSLTGGHPRSVDEPATT